MYNGTKFSESRSNVKCCSKLVYQIRIFEEENRFGIGSIECIDDLFGGSVMRNVFYTQCNGSLGSFEGAGHLIDQKSTDCSCTKIG